jgi:hypothetical protein
MGVMVTATGAEEAESAEEGSAEAAEDGKGRGEIQIAENAEGQRTRSAVIRRGRLSQDAHPTPSSDRPRDLRLSALSATVFLGALRFLRGPFRARFA